MKNRIHVVAAILLAAFVSGCTENSARPMLPMPPATQMSAEVGNPVFETADRWSFARANINYPARNGNHVIPVGDYMLFGLCDALKGTGVEKIRLTKFDSSGHIRFGLPDKTIATLAVEMTYVLGGEAGAAKFGFSERQLGWALMGDYSPIPLIMNTKLSDSRFHDQLRPVLDEAIAALAGQIKGP